MNILIIMGPYFVGVIVLFVLARLILKEADSNQQTEELPGGGVRFAPASQARVAMAVFIAMFAFVGVVGTMSALVNRQGLTLSLVCLIIALLLLRILPGTIVLTSEGLEQHFWLGKAKRVLWGDVGTVPVVQKEGRVTITGLKGGKIQHSKQFPDRDRLLAELRAHCPDRMPGATANVSSGHRNWVIPPPPSA
ncbi:MAG: hypothetical protein P4L40_21850 [Terracidiphilus sp.]|nr:hypothetical protein [Terracidiphilus sp.]